MQTPNSEYTVAAVDEALNLLLIIARAPDLGVTELARRSGNTKARTFRLLTTLEQRGMVHKRDDAATYRLGYQMLALGIAAQEQVSLVRIAQQVLNDLGERCNENVHLRVRDGLESLAVARWESSQSVRVHTEIGHRTPLHAGASGKLLLAHAPAEVQEALLAGERERFTPNTIVSRPKLQQELTRIRSAGFATSFGERSVDAVAVAVPVRDMSGAVAAALGASMPSSRASESRIKTFVSLLQAAAADISSRLGYVPG
jgi:IclR family KDG regulon transcriptional repressor